MHNVYRDIRQQCTGRACTHTRALSKQGAGFSGRNKYRTRPPPDLGGPRGTRGFIFPWLRFNSAALIWLRVFVRVSNDLQRAASEPRRAPCCFSCSPAFYPHPLAPIAACRWIKVRYFSICQVTSVPELHNTPYIFFYFFFFTRQCVKRARK